MHSKSRRQQHRNRCSFVAMHRLVVGLVLALISVAACTVRNPAGCCETADDCITCPSGHVCKVNTCIIPSCTTETEATDCTDPMAPTCDQGICVGCDATHACPDSSQVCELDSGTCVACVLNADCHAAAPICDAHSCRTCSADSECASEACADDGTCVPTAAAAYVDPGGTDSGSCDQAHPCATFQFVYAVMSNVRQHLVIHHGTYPFALGVSPTGTPATTLILHGNDSTIGNTTQSQTLYVNGLQMTARNVTLLPGQDETITVQATATLILEHVNVSGQSYIAGGKLTFRDAHISTPLTSTAISMNAGSTVVIDGAVLSGGGIISNATSGIPTTTLNASNMIISGVDDLALSLGGLSGFVRFTTIASSGNAAGSGAFAVKCSTSANFVVQSTIIWTPGSSAARPPIDTPCTIHDSIIGPTTVAGSINADPMFVNPSLSDFHLMAGSPAHDAVDQGPPTDFEGDARPKGVRFDIGADELRE
jgi:hypothetical protein